MTILNALNATEISATIGLDGPKSRKASRLSNAALVLLSHAASRDDGMVLPPPAALRARGSALSVLLANLLERHLVREIAVDTELHSWRVDEAGCQIGLQISDLGLGAIGIAVKAPGETSASADENLSPNDNGDIDNGTVHDGVENADAARRTEVDSVSTDVIPAQDEPTPRKPTKRDLLVDLLTREGGASIDALTTATHWLPHTVRAALSGLRKNGHAVSRGKDDQGRSIYRIDTATALSAPVGS